MITIRPASKDDVGNLVRWSGILGYQTDEDEMRQRLELIMTERNGVVLIAEVDGNPAGFVQVFKKNLIQQLVTGEIGGLAVDDKVRGQGVGRKLVEAAEIWAKNCGCERLVVKSNVMRQTSHAFYQAVGFEVKKQQKVFDKKLIYLH